jgi:hypothetical protein
MAEDGSTARPSTSHVAVAYLLGEVLDDVVITPPRGAGYVLGSCASARDPRIGAAVLAAGVLDGHGAAADLDALTVLVPDADERAAVLAVVEQLMELAEFRRLRDKFWRALTFRDRLSHRAIERIASSADDMGGPAGAGVTGDVRGGGRSGSRRTARPSPFGLSEPGRPTQVAAATLADDEG